MGRNWVILLLLLFPLCSLAKGNAEGQFGKGNEWYAKAQYKEAAAAYQQVLDSGYVSAAVYYNLGNAYYKLGEMPMAIWNYERAYKLAPSDDDVLTNIQFANLKIADKMEAVPEFFLVKWGRELVLCASADRLAVLSAAGFVSGFVLLAVYLFALSPGIKRLAFYSGIALALAGLLLTAAAGLQDSYLNDSNHAIVFAGTVNVKSGPKDSFKNLFVVHEGLKVAIKEQNGDWIKVELQNGSVGWIRSDDVKEI